MFGRRKREATAVPKAGEQRLKVFPDEVWEGKTGELLRKLGMSPDDESNLVPTVESTQARIEKDHVRLQEKFQSMNRDLQARSGANVIPFFLIPGDCWNDPQLFKFLTMQLELSPYQDWNVVALASDLESSEILNLPVHPRADIPAFVEAAMGTVREAHARFEAARVEAGCTRDLDVYAEARERIKQAIKARAANLSEALFGVWEDRHKAN